MRTWREHLPTALLALLVLLPLLVVATAPLHTEAPEWAYVGSELLPTFLGETAALVVRTVLLALVLGVSTAWLVAANDFPGRKVFRWALVLPLALPTYISAITFADLWGPTGRLSLAMAERTGLHVDLLTPSGLAYVLALVLFPYVYLPARAAFSAGMSDQLDAARMLGGGALRRAFRVAFPLAAPAIAGGALLVAMEVLNDYGAVKHYGVRTLTAGIFRSWGGLYDSGSALRIGGVLLLVVLLLMLLGRIADRGRQRGLSGKRLRPVPLRGVRRWLATVWCALVLLASFGMPFATIAIDAFREHALRAALEFLPATGNTLLIGGLSALATLLLALLLSYGQRRSRSRFAQLAGIGYVVPGAVIAIGVMTLGGALTDLSGIVLIGTVGLMVYAFTVRFLALATQPLRAGLDQQPLALDESARLLGASPWRTFLRVNLPLLKPSLLAAALLVLMEVVKELPLTLILRPFDTDTLSTKVFEMARIEQWGDAAMPALLIVLCGLVPVVLLDRLLERGV
ncbi:MAG: iron ABC transporter permease [Flavobacteriales bacterium]|nr:iron ABC transporter permease [Flavobacteriales bacterium]